MKRLTIATAALAAASLSAPASAGLFHKHYCNCGHAAGSATCGSSSSTSTGGTTTSTGGTTTSTGGTTTSTGGTTTSSGGTTTSSGGTSVPEPGMIGLMGLSLVALGVARRRKSA